MGYLSDWRDAEAAMQSALAAHPDCDRTARCPASEHLLDCRAFRARLAEARRRSDAPS